MNLQQLGGAALFVVVAGLWFAYLVPAWSERRRRAAGLVVPNQRLRKAAAVAGDDVSAELSDQAWAARRIVEEAKLADGMRKLEQKQHHFEARLQLREHAKQQRHDRRRTRQEARMNEEARRARRRRGKIVSSVMLLAGIAALVVGAGAVRVSTNGWWTIVGGAVAVMLSVSMLQALAGAARRAKARVRVEAAFAAAERAGAAGAVGVAGVARGRSGAGAGAGADASSSARAAEPRAAFEQTVSAGTETAPRTQGTSEEDAIVAHSAEGDRVGSAAGRGASSTVSSVGADIPTESTWTPVALPAPRYTRAQIRAAAIAEAKRVIAEEAGQAQVSVTGTEDVVVAGTVEAADPAASRDNAADRDEASQAAQAAQAARPEVAGATADAVAGEDVNRAERHELDRAHAELVEASAASVEALREAESAPEVERIEHAPSAEEAAAALEDADGDDGYGWLRELEAKRGGIDSNALDEIMRRRRDVG